MFGKSLCAAGAFVLSLSFQVGTADAVPVQFCSSGSIDLAVTGCISGSARGYTNGGDGIYSNAGGGDPEAAVEAAILGATGQAVDISLYAEAPGTPLVTLTGAAGQSGTWTVLDGTLIQFITVKAANSFALFDVGGIASGSWSTAGLLNNGGQQPNVSHVRFWTAGPIAAVPIPAAGLMLLAGIGGMGALRRRKKAS